jgi:hypothetical protein
VFGSMLLNLAWAMGETIGAPAAASVSRATSDTVPLVALAALMLATLAISSALTPRWSSPAAERAGSHRESHSR